MFLFWKVCQWLREWGACVNPPKMESPNGAAKLRRGKQSSSLQGKHTNTEIDTQTQGITCTDIDTICTNTLYKYKNLLTRWVMCSRNGSKFNSLTDIIWIPPEFSFISTEQPQTFIFSDIRWSGCVRAMKESTNSLLLVVFDSELWRYFNLTSLLAFTCIEHLPYIHCKEK